MQACRRPLSSRAAIPALMLAFAFGLSGCSFTQVDPTAQDVEVLKSERISDCRRLGDTRVSVADEIGIIPRHANAVKKDLDTLARNSAAEMGGDTVTPMGEPVNGKQTYGVYDCIDE